MAVELKPTKSIKSACFFENFSAQNDQKLCLVLVVMEHLFVSLFLFLSETFLLKQKNVCDVNSREKFNVGPVKLCKLNIVLRSDANCQNRKIK